MWMRLRVLMVWLLACAMPLQGIAAAAMLHCAPVHGRTALAAPASHADHGHAAEAAEHHADHHGHHGGMAPADAALAGTADADAPSVQSCSACAQCSPCSALPSQALLLPAGPVAGPVLTPAPVVHAGVVPGGLERPPRTFLA